LKRKNLVIGGAAGAAAASIAAALLVGTGGGTTGALPHGAQAQVPAASDGSPSSSRSSAPGNDSPATTGPTGDQPVQDVPYAEADALAKVLNVTPAQAVKRLQTQETNSAKADALDQKLGTNGGGSWLDANSGALQTNVLSAQAATVAKAAGATPHLVTASQSALDALQTKLDASATDAPKGGSWGVDVTTDRLALTVTPQTTPAQVTAFLTKAGIIGADVAKVTVHHNGRPVKSRGLVGGDDTEISGGSTGWICSVGFLATQPNGKRVMLTAGHCSVDGKYYRRDADHRSIGHVVAYQFGSKATHASGYRGDWSMISVDHPSLWHPTGPYVNRYKSKFTVVSVRGSKVAPINSFVCKSGQTSHWTCGRILYRNWSGDVAYGAYDQYLMTIKGLTATSICSQGGDSGGPVMFNSQAQGLVSAGSDCATPNDVNTVIQPINPVLAQNHLKLLVKH
jgi:streptogrisin C